MKRTWFQAWHSAQELLGFCSSLEIFQVIINTRCLKWQIKSSMKKRFWYTEQSTLRSNIPNSTVPEWLPFVGDLLSLNKCKEIPKISKCCMRKEGGNHWGDEEPGCMLASGKGRVRCCPLVGIREPGHELPVLGAGPIDIVWLDEEVKSSGNG